MTNWAKYSFVGVFIAATIAGSQFLKPRYSETPAQFPLAHSYDQAASLSATGDAPFIASRADSQFALCGPYDPPVSTAFEEQLATFSTFASEPPVSLSSAIPARDLPGIVKLEPERDVSETETITGHCSATRIAENWFLTAAHCIAEGHDRLVLKAGSEQLSSFSTQRVEADFAVCHGSFRGTETNFAHDIALIHVNDDSLSQLADVPIVSWGATRETFSRSKFKSARVGGWGLIEYGGDLADFLQKEELDVASIDDDRISLSSRYGSGPCIGDSGGPLMVEEDGQPVMMGVLSTLGANRDGRICSGNYLARYINLASHRDWIEATMSVCTVDSRLCRRF